MKKTIRINIGGFVFHIDDDAYEALSNYLNAISSRFSNSEEGTEIIADVESRIAELFQEKTSALKEVITLDDVKSVIEILGNPEVFEDAQDENEKKAPKSETSHIKTAKRFYRDTDSRVIGGVCSGIGHYFGIDPVIVRIIFLLALFAYGTGPLIYIVLWFVIPEALSTSQKLEMRGEPINIDNIQKTVAVEFSNVKQNFDKWKKTDSYKNTTSSFHGFFQALGKFFDGLFKVLGYIFAIILIINGLTLLIALFVATFFNFSFGEHAMSLPFFVNLFTDSIWAHLGLIGASLVLVIPLVSLIYVGIKILFRIKTRNKIVGIVASILFTIGVILVFAGGVNIIKEYKTESSFVENLKVDKFKADTLYLAVNLEELKTPMYQNMNDNFDELRFTVDKNKTRLFGRPRIDVMKSETDDIEISINHKARGMYKNDANDNAKEINYIWLQRDSLIKFSPYFQIPERQKWRNQAIHITIKLPVGKVIYLDESLENYLFDIENIQHYWDGDMLGKKWSMTERGLSIFGIIKDDNIHESTNDKDLNDMKKELKKM